MRKKKLFWYAGKSSESGSHHWEDTVSGWIEIEKLQWDTDISGAGIVSGYLKMILFFIPRKTKKSCIGQGKSIICWVRDK